MTHAPSMPFFPADFFADTAHLSDNAAHAYLFLLGHAWLQGAKLPDDDIVLARLARIRGCHWGRTKQEVMQFWHLGEDGFWRNHRLTKEYEFVAARAEISRANGAKAGAATVRAKVEIGVREMKVHVPFSDSVKSAKPLKYNEATIPSGLAPNPNPIKEDSLIGGSSQKRADRKFVETGTKQWNAWEKFYRKSKGEGLPEPIGHWETKKLGWYFETEWPPDQDAAT